MISRKIVIVHASIGSGHRLAAESIAQQITALAPDAIVEVVDLLDFRSMGPDGDTLSAAFSGPLSGIYDRAWHAKSLIPLARTFVPALLSAVYGRFMRYLKSESPDTIVCTHTYAAAIAARMVRKGMIHARTIGVATDYEVHGMWPTGLDTMCTSGEAASSAAVSIGFREDQLLASGIPIRPQFCQAYDRTTVLERLGIPPGSRVILAIAGSSRRGPYQNFKQALATSLPAIGSIPRTSLWIITGDDEAYAQELLARADGFISNHVHIAGHVDQIAPLIASADLVLAKAGGSICAECVALGAPTLLVGPAVGQEASNVAALTKVGAAFFCADPKVLARDVNRCIASPERLARMHASAAALGRPNAARTIAEHVLS